MTVHQLEAGTSQPRHATLDVVRHAFEKAGVEFIDENGGGAGVRLRKPHHSAKRKWLFNCEVSKCIGPAARRMINAHDLNSIALYTVRNNERRFWNDQLSCSRNTARTSHLGVFGKKRINIVQDVKDDALCCCWIVFGNKGAQRSKVIDCLWRPDWCHGLEGLGAGRSLTPPQEPTHSLTS